MKEVAGPGAAERRRGETIDELSALRVERVGRRLEVRRRSVRNMAAKEIVEIISMQSLVS